MAASDTDNTRKGAGGKKKDEKERALQDIGLDFTKLASMPGAGQAGGKRFGEALNRPLESKDGGEKPPAGPGALQGLDQMTRNLKFAQKLSEERRDLDIGTRSTLEGMLGRPLDDVNVYVGKYASAAAKHLNAEGFAVGKHVFVDEAKFAPGTAEGMGLLAHELTHTMQGAEDSVEEREDEAHALEHRVTQGIKSGQQQMDLAMEQGSSDPSVSEQVTAGSKPSPQAGKRPEQDKDPAVSSLAPDDAEIEKVIIERVLEMFRLESDIDMERHGRV